MTFHSRSLLIVIGITLPLAGVEGKGPSSRVADMFIHDLLGLTNRKLPIEFWFPPGYQTSGRAKGPQNKNSSPIMNVHNVVYLTEVNIGGQDFQLVIDTGSADTWVASDPFQCRNARREPVKTERCRLNEHYRKSGTYAPSDRTLRTAYADGEKLDGEIGTDVVTLGGIAVNTTVGLVHDANWNGDGVSSGLLGMAFPSITRSFKGHALTRYDPVFFDMYKKSLVKPMFSVALPRHNEQAGALALGGLPDKSVVNYKDDFATTRMEQLQVLKPGGSPELTMYIANVQDFLVNGKVVPNSQANMVVDTGTTMTFVPPCIMNAIAAAWEPPLTDKNMIQGLYRTPCDSKPPKLEMKIGGKNIQIDGQDLFVNQGHLGSIPEKGKMCMVGVAAGAGFVGQGMGMMGGTFMKSLVAVFDVGAAEMRFAERIRTEDKKKIISWAA
jgi:aspergillopepsin I